MEKKKIVFFELVPNVMIYKIAKLFKQNGYKTISVIISKSDNKFESFYGDAFDKVISFNSNSINNYYSKFKLLINTIKAILNISKIKPDVIIGRAKPNLHCALTKIIIHKTPFIYFPYDIRAFDYEEEFANIPEFEIKAEKFCFENAEGVIHKGGKDELNYLNGKRLGNNIKLCSNVVNFLPYCSKEFSIPLNKNKLSKKDKEIHMVHIGCMGTIGDDNFSVRYCKELAKNKIHIHLYSTSDIPHKLIEDELKNGYMHLHSILNPKEIVKEISKYDFGLSLLPEISKNNPEKKFDTGNKTASYLEAGLPMIYISSVYEEVFITKFIKKYNLGFCLELKDIANFKKIDIKYKELEKNVIKAREDFLMENHFDELERFIEKVYKSKIFWEE